MGYVAIVQKGLYLVNVIYKRTFHISERSTFLPNQRYITTTYNILFLTQLMKPPVDCTVDCLLFLLFVTLFGFFLGFGALFAFASIAPSSPVRTPPDAIYDRFFACFLVNRVFVVTKDSLVLAINAAECIAISALLHNCSMISCSGLLGLCDPLRSDSNTIAI